MCATCRELPESPGCNSLVREIDDEMMNIHRFAGGPQAGLSGRVFEHYHKDFNLLELRVSY